MIAPVQKLLCLMLVLWLALQVGLTQAHAVRDAALEPSLSAHVVQQVSQPDALQSQHCSLAHCGHSLGLPRIAVDATACPTSAAAPAGERRMRSRVAPHEVERPKWAAVTTRV